MATHEFGVMPSKPLKGVRYDEYEPSKYNCISVDDDYLENIISDFDGIDFYSHTIDIPAKGLMYCGITLIPPSSIPKCIAIIENISQLSILKQLMQKAYNQDKWIIHYGL